MNVPSDLQYTATHEWVKKTAAGYECGITDYAQKELSDVVFVELPEIGKQVKKGETLCVVESVKAASDIYAPLSGEVVAANDAVAASPESVNSDPYGTGAICTVKPSNPSELDELMNADAYKKHIGA